MTINKQIRQTFYSMTALTSCVLLSACFDPNSHSNQWESSSTTQPSHEEHLQIAPSSESSLDILQAQQRNRVQSAAIVTDQASLNGIDLTLLDEQGGCQLQSSLSTPSAMHYLKPMAPCYFMRKDDQLQTVKRDQQTIVAVVGTPVTARCGQEVQGVALVGKQLELSQRIGQGNTFCANKGLDSFHFSLFFNEV
ncbi:MAG: hypothetical protein ACWA5U_11010 [bacterium]